MEDSCFGLKFGRSASENPKSNTLGDAMRSSAGRSSFAARLKVNDRTRSERAHDMVVMEYLTGSILLFRIKYKSLACSKANRFSLLLLTSWKDLFVWELSHVDPDLGLRLRNLDLSSSCFSKCIGDNDSKSEAVTARFLDGLCPPCTR